MSKIMKVVIGLPVVLLIGSLAAFTGWPSIDKQSSLAAGPDVQPVPTTPRAMTLLEAWDALDAYGKMSKAQIAIASIQSVDVDGDTAASGKDGYRRSWAAVLIGEDSSVWLTLVDGVVTEKTVQPLPPGFSALSKPSVDSPQAVILSQAARPNFRASEDKKGQGFRFVLEINDQGQEELGVLGAVGQTPAQIRLDPQTGAVHSAQMYTFAPTGGILYSTDSGQSWQASTLSGKMVTAVYPDPGQENLAYAVVAGQEGIAVHQTKDGGATWDLMGSLPQEAGVWPFDLLALRDTSGQLSLLVGTWNGLWVSKDGQAWSQVNGLPQGPAQWLAAVRSNQGDRLLVSISAGDNRGLYTSKDFSPWTKVTEKVYRLSESFDRQTVLASSEEQAGQGLVLDIERERPVSLPAPVLSAAGDFQGKGPVLFRSPVSGLGSAEGIEHRAKWTLSVPVASLVAAPDYLTSKVAIAGGFRSGIYRTSDDGGHWELVLTKPSSILQGNNEIYDIAFLSPTTVIVINGGELTWQGF